MTDKPSIIDPHAVREAEKYENPIPSREYILSFIKERGKPISFRQLALVFEFEEEEKKEALRRRLRAMERDSQLVRNRKGSYGLADSAALVKGRFVSHREGYGFVIPDEGGGDLFVGHREASAVFHNDEVLVRVVGIDDKGRREGVIVEITQRNTAQVVGRYFEENKIGVVEPSDHFRRPILVPQRCALPVKQGQFVVVTIIQQPTKHSQALGEVIEILGDHMAPGMEIDVAIRSYQLPFEWSRSVTGELKAIPDSLQPEDYEGRKDCRALCFVTIDGEDAKDFDDAVYVEKTATGWHLYVAIADVSHYVKAFTALDVEAYSRGNSVYFPNRVIPMLPEKLSNDLCSLNPLVDRLCMVAEMSIDEQGHMKRSQFYPAVIHSKARLTYTQVAAYLELEEPAIPESVAPAVKELFALYQALRASRDVRGAIDMDVAETRIIFSETKKIERIVPTERNVAHRMIEEAMLCANVAAAKFIEKHKLLNLFRVHAVPSPEKVEKLRLFLKDLGLTFTQALEPEPIDYANLLQSVKGRPDQHIITLVLLRTLSQAKYAVENIGHFGLAFKTYTHFTSPIRRYPDLLVHRAIKAALKNEVAFTDVEVMKAMAVHCSSTERRADEATRDVMDWLKCEYMMDKKGQEFEGVISSVTQFGLFVELKAVYVEGLVHVTSLQGDYYIFDQAKQRLFGEKTRVQYGLGDAVTIKVVGVDLDTRHIDFEVVSKGKKKK